MVVLKPREVLEAFNFLAPGVGPGDPCGVTAPRGWGFSGAKTQVNVPVLGVDSADLGWDLPRGFLPMRGNSRPTAGQRSGTGGLEAETGGGRG